MTFSIVDAGIGGSARPRSNEISVRSNMETAATISSSQVATSRRSRATISAASRSNPFIVASSSRG